VSLPSDPATVVPLRELAVRPEPGDNAALVIRTVPAGSRVTADGPGGPATFTVPHTVPEGHRIVVSAVAAGEPLLSWSTPFALAERDLVPGDYVCTEGSLDALRSRGHGDLPATPTARNVPMQPYALDPASLHVGDQAAAVADGRTFLGFDRATGVPGTRNHVVVVAATSRSSAFVTELARRFAGEGTDGPDGFDGVVPVAHTEGGEDESPTNLDMLLTVLAGFLVHPNVGAVMLVDEPGSVVSAAAVRAQATRLGLPAVSVPHAYFTRRGAFADDLAAAADLIRGWLPEVASQRRTPQPLSGLRIALQCGGSDAFSGITANPLAGAVGREVVRRGGATVLAETDELIGAEGYVLENVRSEEVARRFLRSVESFKERAGWHGHTAEGNPSGGNLYRGLYNIVLKSVGAGRKRDRMLRLDHVVDYGEPLPGPGFTFMDSPGNDLESVAGEVASGCNLVFFTTGNGSITNFPFVPTLKFVTTTARYDLLSHEMDVDAGRYLTGTPMPELTDEVLGLTIETAAGRRTAGELAGHSQVSIWRQWRQTGPREGISVAPNGSRPRPLEQLPAEERDALLDGRPLPVAADVPAPPAPDLGFTALRADGRTAPEHLGLVLPTSLCSGQIALRLAGQAEEEGWLGETVDRVVALPHTEGCGVTSGAAEETFARTMVGHLLHPDVRVGLLLEHGCEKTHNDYFRHRLVEAGADPDRFGWASIQADGGLAAVTDRVRDWFTEVGRQLDVPREASASLGDLSIGLDARGPLAPGTVQALATVGTWLVRAGGTVLLSSRSALLADPAFRRAAFGSDGPVPATLAHAQRPAAPGWHVMRMPGGDWLETVTGMAACGAQLVLAHVAGGSLTASRMVPVVQVSGDAATLRDHGADLDAELPADPAGAARAAVAVLRAIASREVASRAQQRGDVGFQVTRGLLGVSM